MAIKGKRKSQKKTRPSRPRPAASSRAPRAVAASLPFHRTFEGQLAAILVGLVVAGFAMFTIADARSEDAVEATRAGEIRTYTSDIEGLLTSVNEPVREMSGAPFNTDDRVAIADLKDRAKAWIDDLEGAGALASAIAAPADLAPANRVFTQALQAYSGAARTYRLVPDATGALRKELLDSATQQRTVANEIMISGIQMLDLIRAEVGMDPSDLQAPGTLPPVVPTPAAHPSPEEDDTKGGGKGGGKGKKEDK